MSDAAHPAHADAPTREVVAGDGIAWLRSQTLTETHAIVTSMPDVSELSGMSFEAWRAWFMDTASLICASVAPRAVALFYQTDVLREDGWVDKAYLVMRGAEQAGVALLFHKIVCRVPAGVTTFGRPAYAHLLAFSRELVPPRGKRTADVLPRLGKMTWSRAMGTEACAEAARFVRTQTACTTIVDPFCGVGTMLAVANAHGLSSIGVELSKKRARQARNLALHDETPPRER